MLYNPRMPLYLIQRYPLLRVEDKQLHSISIYLPFLASDIAKHTLLIRSFASGLTKPGTVISPLAILLWVITGASSNGASPTRNSYVRTPKLHRSTFSL